MQIARFTLTDGTTISTADMSKNMGAPMFETLAMRPDTSEPSRVRTKNIQAAAYAHCEMVEELGGTAQLQLGDCLVYQWGYGQTNTQFFKVIKRTRTQIVFREIAGMRCTVDGWSGTKIPNRDSFIGEPMRRTVKTYRGSAFVSMPSGVARKWRGWPVAYSTHA